MMHSSEVEDNVCSDRAGPTPSSGGRAAVSGHSRRWTALWWGLSCAVHLVLLIGIGWWSRTLVHAPPEPAIRLAFIPALVPSPTGETVALPPSLPPKRRALEDPAVVPVLPSDPEPVPHLPPPPPLLLPTEPERAVKRALPEPPAPELLEVPPAVAPRRQPRAALTPPRASRSDLQSLAQKPPPPRLSPAVPVREVPGSTRPAPSAEDVIVARLPPDEPRVHTAPTAQAPPVKEPTIPRASLPRSAGVRYGQSPTPAYPVEARRRGWEGTVVLMVEILESGRPERVTIKQSSGHSVLDEAASRAVGRWTFIPAQQDGKPVRGLAEVPIVFSLQAQR